MKGYTKEGARSELILGQILYGVGMVPWLIVWFVNSVLIHKSGTNEALELAMYSYPLSYVLSIALSWGHWTNSKYKEAHWWNLLPLASILVIIASIFV